MEVPVEVSGMKILAPALLEEKKVQMMVIVAIVVIVESFMTNEMICIERTIVCHSLRKKQS